MNNYTEMDIIIMIAAGVFCGIVFSEVIFATIQILVSDLEEDEE